RLLHAFRETPRGTRSKLGLREHERALRGNERRRRPSIELGGAGQELARRIELPEAHEKPGAPDAVHSEERMPAGEDEAMHHPWVGTAMKLLGHLEIVERLDRLAAERADHPASSRRVGARGQTKTVYVTPLAHVPDEIFGELRGLREPPEQHERIDPSLP